MSEILETPGDIIMMMIYLVAFIFLAFLISGVLFPERKLDTERIEGSAILLKESLETICEDINTKGEGNVAPIKIPVDIYIPTDTTWFIRKWDYEERVFLVLRVFQKIEVTAGGEVKNYDDKTWELSVSDRECFDLKEPTIMPIPIINPGCKCKVQSIIKDDKEVFGGEDRNFQITLSEKDGVVKIDAEKV